MMKILACLASSAALSAAAADWPQWLGPQRDAIWREDGIVDSLPPGSVRYRWRTPIGGGYAGPAVANGRVYVADRQLSKGASNPADPFQRGKIQGTERVVCLDEASGKILWTHEYDCPYDLSYPAGPRTTPVVHSGKVYALGAEGHLFCLNALTGEPIWSRSLKADYQVPTPLWGFAGHPLIDGDQLICLVGGTNSVAVSFHKDTGKELWRTLSAKEPGYSPPMINELGGTRQLIIWHPASVNSLNPKTGELYWSFPFAVKSALTAPTARQAGNKLFVTSFYNGSVLLEVAGMPPAAKMLWRSQSDSERKTDTLHSIISTPFIEGDHIYGVCSYGQLRCLRLDTGERVWETLKATTLDGKEARWANAFIIKHRDRFLLFNEKGELIFAKLSPAGYEEISRAPLLEPSNTAAGRDVLWSHPAFANGHVIARNDKEIVSVNLRK